MRLPAALIVALLCLHAVAIRAQGAEETLKKLFQEESFVDGKTRIALELAALKTHRSREVLQELFASTDSWDAAGAFHGLFALGDPGIDEILAKRYLDDLGMRGFVAEIFASKPERFLPYFKKAFTEETMAYARSDLLRTVGSGSGKAVEDFLLSIVKDGASEWREEAYLAYSGTRRSGDAFLARSLVKDPEIKDNALARLAVIGDRGDLGLFAREFYSDPRPQVRLPAMKAIHAWGGTDEKLKAFAAALKDNDSSVIESAFSIFQALRSESLMAEAGRIADSRLSSFARVAAAEYLAGYGKEAAIALAIPAFEAVYETETQRPGLGDWIAHVMTLGLSTMLEGYSKARGAKDLQRRKEDAAKIFSALAGKKIPADYEAWEDWCLSRGLSVRGRNILQELLSSDTMIREEAKRAALGLLGFESEKTYAAARPGYASLDDFKQLLDIAQALRERGYPDHWQ